MQQDSESRLTVSSEHELEPHEAVDGEDTVSSDYSFVNATARVAVYDDMKMPPHIIEIKPAPTADFIEHLATCINDEKLKLGGKIPYGAIREVAENFIHARFTEVVVSILDGGNTIRFCDQGPGIESKDKATLPGFTSASEPMKHYIRGVGSGLPLVKEYLDFSGGRISIEDNIRQGSVVTMTLKEEEPAQMEPAAQIPAAQAAMTMQNPAAQTAPTPQIPVVQSVPLQQTQVQAAPVAPKPAVQVPPLSDREVNAIFLFADKGALGNKDIMEALGIAGSSANSTLKKLEQKGIIEVIANKKRTLTDFGFAVYEQLG